MSGIARIFLGLLGLVLVLPGICSLAFIADGSLKSGSELWLLWTGCFVVSAFGIWALINAFRRPAP